MPDEGSGEVIDSNGNFEDPRMWSGLGFASPADNPHSPQYSPQLLNDSERNQWQEADLDELLRATPPPVKPPPVKPPAARPTPSIERSGSIEPATTAIHTRQPAMPAQSVARHEPQHLAAQPAAVMAQHAVAQVESETPRPGTSVSTIITIVAVLMIIAAVLFFFMGPGV